MPSPGGLQIRPIQPGWKVSTTAAGSLEGHPGAPRGTVCICQPQPIILLSCVHSPEVLTRADCVDASPGPREAVTLSPIRSSLLSASQRLPLPD